MAKNIFLFLLIAFSSCLHSMALIDLSSEEKAFIKKHPTITLGSDHGWGPFVIQNDDNKISGYDADILALINQVSGANFVLTLGNWKDITASQQRREIDGLSTAVTSPLFSQHSLFSNTYLSLDKIIFTRKSLSYPVNSITDLEGKKFGIYKDNSLARETAKQIKDVQIIEFDSTQTLIEGITTSKADFMLGNAAMFYLLNKAGNPFLTPAIFLSESPLNLVFVIRDDYPEAISIINKSLKIIADEKLLQIKNKWFSSKNPIDNSVNAQFSNEELTYLEGKKYLNLCVDPDWMPLEKIENGVHIGMAADYFKIFEQHIGIPITLVKTKTWEQTIQFAKNKKCDLISLAMPTKERNSYLNFSTPLFKTPIVLATQPHITFIDDLALIDNKKIGMVKNYAFNKLVRERYPNIEVIDVNNAQQGLQKVVNGELFGYIDALATVAYMFQTNFIGELKISGKFQDNWEMSVATRKDEPLLVEIINKLIAQISEQTHQQIFRQYVAIEYKQPYNYQLFWRIIMVILCVLLLLIYRYNALKKYNHRIKHYLFVIDNHVLTASFNTQGIIIEASSALSNLTGYKKEELLGLHHNIFHHPNTDKYIYKSLFKTINQGKLWRGELLALNKNGSVFWSSTTITPTYSQKRSLLGYTVILQDISDKKRLEKISVTDELTQIPNRLFINTSFDHEFERCKRYNSYFSLILIDIDNFKKVNDIYGHKIGDDTLINIAIILKQNIRQLDYLGRWGGEEFLMICPEINLMQAENIAEKIREIIEQFEFSENINLSCSFGVTQSHPSDNKETIFYRADKALYNAKNKGRNQVKSVPYHKKT